MKKWLLLAGAISTEVTGSLSLKGALDQPLLYIVVVAGFISAFVFLSLVLKEGLALGVAYGIWGALGVAATAIMSAVLFGEALTPTMIVGLVIIIGGVLCVELGSQSAHKKQAARASAAQATGAARATGTAQATNTAQATSAAQPTGSPQRTNSDRANDSKAGAL